MRRDGKASGPAGHHHANGVLGTFYLWGAGWFQRRVALAATDSQLRDRGTNTALAEASERQRRVYTMWTGERSRPGMMAQRACSRACGQSPPRGFRRSVLPLQSSAQSPVSSSYWSVHFLDAQSRDPVGAISVQAGGVWGVLSVGLSPMGPIQGSGWNPDDHARRCHRHLWWGTSALASANSRSGNWLR